MNQANNVASQEISYDVGLRDYMLGVYKQMAIALLITGLMSTMVVSSEAMTKLFLGTPLAYVVLFAPVALAIYMGVRFTKISVGAARNCLWLYAGLMGLSLSSLFLIYTGESIARTFFVTASVFGAMSIYGYTTKRDLTGLGSFLIMGLVGIVIASLVNLFFHSSAVSFIVSVLGVLIFTGLTAYDVQKIKQVYFEVCNDRSLSEKFAVYGALSLYMDFINLFIHLHLYLSHSFSFFSTKTLSFLIPSPLVHLGLCEATVSRDSKAGFFGPSWVLCELLLEVLHLLLVLSVTLFLLSGACWNLDADTLMRRG